MLRHQVRSPWQYFLLYYFITYINIVFEVVLSTCPLYPRDEVAYHRRGFRDGVDFVAELRLVRTWTGAILIVTCVLVTLVLRLQGFPILAAWYRNGRLCVSYMTCPFFCYLCLTLLVWHSVPSTSPLDPRDETANHRS